MNHPREWAKFYDTTRGVYRYKHKGSGVVRDTLMAIGRRFGEKSAKKAAKKAATAAATAVVEKASEKGSQKIQEILRRRPSQPSKLSKDSQKKLQKIMQPSKLSKDSRKKLQKIMNETAASRKVNQILAAQD